MKAQSVRGLAKPDLILSCAIFIICGGALALSFTYSSSMSLLLPRVAAGLGMLCAAWMVVGATVTRRRLDEETPVALPATSAHEPTSTVEGVSDTGQDDPNDAEYILSNTPKRVWITTIGFICGFFLVLYLCGLFIAAAALSLVYLVVVGQKSWLFSVTYTVILTGLLWGLMRGLTYIPSPPGVLFPGG